MSSAVKKSGMPALRLQMVDNRIIEQSIKAGEQGTQKILNIQNTNENLD